MAKRQTPEEGFWRHVEKTNNCWNWLSAVSDSGKGYGRFSAGGRLYDSAHRFSWELHKGKIPKGKNVLHTCDNVRCVRPEHLFLGTQVENMRDMFLKNRGGTKQKLTVEQVRQIKKIGRSERQVDLAKKFNIGQDQISRILSEKRWSYVKC